MSALCSAIETELCLLPSVRDSNAADMSELQPWSGTRMVELPALRSEIALTCTADCLVAIATEGQRFSNWKKSRCLSGSTIAILH
jgi:hypothetical protein